MNPHVFGSVHPGPRFHSAVPITLPVVRYFNSYHIETSRICRLCSHSRSFTSHCQNSDRTTIPWVVVKLRIIISENGGFSIATEGPLVQSQIWIPEATERLNLHNPCTNHIAIQSELNNLIEVKTVTVNCRVFGGQTGPFPTVRVFRVVRPVATVRFWVELYPEPTGEFWPIPNTNRPPI